MKKTIKLIEYSEFTFSEEQTQVAEELLSLANREVILEGPGGVGKSLVISYVINKLVEKNTLVQVISPTHKASKVLFNYLNKDKDLLDEQVDVSTVASYLGQQPTITTEGKQIFAVNKFLSYEKEEKVLVVDEASMLDKYQINEIYKTLTENCSVIYVGDRYQLPPINCVTSPIFEKGIKILTLTKVLRSKGNILTFGDAIRNKKENLGGCNWDKFAQWIAPHSDIKLYCDIEIFKRELRNCVLNSNLNENKDEVRVLSYTNKVSDYYNDFYRGEILGIKELDKWQVGDSCIAASPFKRSYIEDGKNIEGILLNNSEEFTLTKFVETITKTHSEYKDYPILVEKWEAVTEDESPITVYLLPLDNNLNTNYEYVESELRKLGEKSSELARGKNYKSKESIRARTLWKHYYNFIEQFDNARFSFAITIHKSQGSSISNVFLTLDFMNLKLPSVVNIRRALLYTGVSRASTSLHILVSKALLGTKVSYCEV